MRQKEDNRINTDQAWQNVYARLERDGLVDTHTQPRRLPRLSAIRWAAAVAILVVAGAALYLAGGKKGQPPSPDLLTLHNEQGAATLVTLLEDGSIVYLADGSRLHYPEHFSAEKREVTLEGDALFDVAGNKERPFLIETGGMRVEVLGTAFRLQSAERLPFELSVSRGEVEVTSKRSGESLRVRAGQTLTLRAGQLVVGASGETGISRFTQRIRFKDEPLANILQVINRESTDLTIEAVPSLANRKLTVTFADNTPETIAELLCAYLHTTYKRENNKLLISDP